MGLTYCNLLWLSRLTFRILLWSSFAVVFGPLNVHWFVPRSHTIEFDTSPWEPTVADSVKGGGPIFDPVTGRKIAE